SSWSTARGSRPPRGSRRGSTSSRTRFSSGEPYCASRAPFREARPPPAPEPPSLRADDDLDLHARVTRAAAGAGAPEGVGAGLVPGEGHGFRGILVDPHGAKAQLPALEPVRDVLALEDDLDGLARLDLDTRGRELALPRRHVDLSRRGVLRSRRRGSDQRPGGQYESERSASWYPSLRHAASSGRPHGILSLGVRVSMIHAPAGTRLGNIGVPVDRIARESYGQLVLPFALNQPWRREL